MNNINKKTYIIIAIFLFLLLIIFFIFIKPKNNFTKDTTNGINNTIEQKIIENDISISRTHIMSEPTGIFYIGRTGPLTTPFIIDLPYGEYPVWGETKDEGYLNFSKIIEVNKENEYFRFIFEKIDEDFYLEQADPAPH